MQSHSPNQHNAATRLRFYEEQLADIRQERNQFTRWEIASVLTLNTGTLISVFNLDNMAIDHRLISMSLFSAGILLTLTWSKTLQNHLGTQIIVMGLYVDLWSDNLAADRRNPAKAKNLRDLHAEVEKQFWKPKLFRKLALLTYFAGLAAVGYSFFLETRLLDTSTEKTTGANTAQWGSNTPQSNASSNKQNQK